jgi:glycosyltransferase involved in cell wall biosynthesis
MDNLVTIAFPVYERTTYFEEAIESAINQIIRVPIIVVDNASSHDRFKDICNKYPNRVKYYRNETNIGMFPNWNRCVKLSETDYVMIVGDDDVLYNDFIERFYHVHDQYSDIGVFYTNVEFLFHENDKIYYKEGNWKNIWGLHTTRDLKAKAFDYQLEFPSIACIIKKSLLLYTPFLEEIHAANDKFFVYNLPDDTLFYGDRDICYIYRRHESNDSSNKKVGPNLIVAHCMIFFACLPYSKNPLWTTFQVYMQTEYFYLKYSKEFNNFMLIESPYRDYYRSMFSFKKIIIIVFSALLLTIRTVWHGIRLMTRRVRQK